MKELTIKITEIDENNFSIERKTNGYSRVEVLGMLQVVSNELLNEKEEKELPTCPKCDGTVSADIDSGMYCNSCDWSITAEEESELKYK